MALSTLNSGAEYAKEKVAADLQVKTFDFAGAVFRLSLLTGLAFGILILGAVMWDVLGDGTGFLFDRGLSLIHI